MVICYYWEFGARTALIRFQLASAWCQTASNKFNFLLRTPTHSVDFASETHSAGALGRRHTSGVRHRRLHLSWREERHEFIPLDWLRLLVHLIYENIISTRAQKAVTAPLLRLAVDAAQKLLQFSFTAWHLVEINFAASGFGLNSPSHYRACRGSVRSRK